MNELIKQDVVVVDSIKNEFYIYYDDGSLNDKQYKKDIQVRKYRYYINLQNTLLSKYKLSLFESKSMVQLTKMSLDEYQRYCCNINFIRKFSSSDLRTYKRRKGIIKKYYNTQSILGTIYYMIKDNILPRRYLPKIELVVSSAKRKQEWYKTDLSNFCEYKKEYENLLYNRGIFKIIFKESIISLMIQKNLDINIVNFFKDLTQYDNGMPFNDYIDKWAKRLLNEEIKIENRVQKIQF